jgi:hypothetical protein
VYLHCEEIRRYFWSSRSCGVESFCRIIAQPHLPLSFYSHQPHTLPIFSVRSSTTLSNTTKMTSENYDTFDSPWHRRVLSRFRSAVAKYWNRLIYEPFQLLIRTLIRWLYGPNPPLFVHNWISAKGIAPASPLPLMRKRRLSITEFTLPGQSRTASKYNRLFSKLAKVQHLGSTTSTPPETYTLPPRFLERLVGRHDEFQCTAAQDQCPLLTKLPLELRLQIYGHVLGYRTLHIIHSHVPSLSLPPRFSLRTHPFHKRLDFEICKAPESHLNRNSVSEICTRASIRKSKFNGLGLIPALRYRGGTDQVADKVMVRVKYLLQKYERKGGPLALLKTCRIMYVLVSFNFSHPAGAQLLSKKLCNENRNGIRVRGARFSCISVRCILPLTLLLDHCHIFHLSTPIIHSHTLHVYIVPS